MSLENQSLNEIIDFIIPRYHERHKEQLQELIVLAQKVESVHADHENCPKGLTAHLQYIFDDLSQHMMKEEQILFPMIKMGNYMMARMPIRVMEQEHEASSNDLGVLKQLTNNATPPTDACHSWTTLYAGISEFISDLEEHIHTENNILFPRVIAEG